jgi:demethylmenaquinone methyltransferase / 2-methoxy-6-polyprenyl-1,4-benzoquinol methylase
MSTNAAEFAPVVDDVFTRIARRYDLLCDVFSLGAHRYWKNQMAQEISQSAKGIILDVGSGTGDIPYRLLQRISEDKMSGVESLIVSDICPAMMDIAKERIGFQNPKVLFRMHDGYNLQDIPDESVDIYTTSFVMKICDRERIVSEARRVLKKGGSFYCLEAARIPLPFLHRMYLMYMDWCLPVIARIATGGDQSAFLYLLKGVHGFPTQTEFVSELSKSGFTNVTYRNLTFGIVALHKAVKE